MIQHIVALKCSRQPKRNIKQYGVGIPSSFINRHKDYFKAKDKMVLLAHSEATPFLILIPEKQWFYNKHARDQIIKFLENFEWVI